MKYIAYNTLNEMIIISCHTNNEDNIENVICSSHHYFKEQIKLEYNLCDYIKSIS